MICASPTPGRKPLRFDAISALRASPLLSEVGPEALQKLAGIASYHHYPRGNVLFYEGDSGRTVYLVVRGEIKVFQMSQDGREVMLDTFRQGGMIGLVSLLDAGSRPASAITLTDSHLARFEGSRLREWMDGQPAAQQGLNRELARELRRAYGRIGEQALMSVRERLLSTLLEIARRDGVAQAGEHWVAFVRPTHQELAERIGTCREVVTRLLKSLSDGGSLEAEGRVIRVPRSALILEDRHQ